MRKRTQAREIALQALYQFDRLRLDAGALEGFVDDATPDPVVRRYAKVLVTGTVSLIAQIDERIAAAAEKWKLSRIAPVDRSILRLALYEILEADEVPPKVAINEAIELAKTYSTEQSGAFVNGILDRIYKDLAGEGQAGATIEEGVDPQETL